MHIPVKISQAWNRLRSSKLFRLCTDKYILVTTAFAVICIIDHNGVTTLIRNKYEIERQREAIEQYRSAISSVENRISSLTTDRDSIEAFAREEYFYRRDGEDVFIVEE